MSCHIIHGASVISQSWASGQSSLRDPECVWKLFLSLDVAVTGSSAAIGFDVPHSVQDCRQHSNRLMCKSVMKFHFFLTLKCKYVISNLRLTVFHLCRMKPSIYLTRLLLFWLFSPSSSLFCLLSKNSENPVPQILQTGGDVFLKWLKNILWISCHLLSKCWPHTVMAITCLHLCAFSLVIHKPHLASCCRLEV